MYDDDDDENDDDDYDDDDQETCVYKYVCIRSVYSHRSHPIPAHHPLHAPTLYSYQILFIMVQRVVFPVDKLPTLTPPPKRLATCLSHSITLIKKTQCSQRVSIIACLRGTES